jgi:hypothetical protein
MSDMNLSVNWMTISMSLRKQFSYYGVTVGYQRVLAYREFLSIEVRSNMQFVHHDLGNVKRGQIVEISLSGNAANVQLLDSINFNNYRNGRNYRYIGGLAKQSPVRLQIPRSGHWHVAVDLRGLGSTVRSSVRILPGHSLPNL